MTDRPENVLREFISHRQCGSECNLCGDAKRALANLTAERDELLEALANALSVVRDDSLSAGERLYDLDENLRATLSRKEES